jgi:hypothetical protein
MNSIECFKEPAVSLPMLPTDSTLPSGSSTAKPPRRVPGHCSEGPSAPCSSSSCRSSYMTTCAAP